MPSPQKRAETYYPFLDLLNEHQAIAQGASLSDKVSYALYRAIQKNSKIEKANKNALFNITMPIDGLVDMTREQIILHLKRLSEDRLICQIFYLKNEGARLKLSSCYLSLSNFDSPASIFLATLRMSVVSVDAMLKTFAVPDIDVVKAAFRADFEKKTVNSKTHPEVLIDPFHEIKKENFDLNPPPHLIESSINEIKKELIGIKRLVEVKAYGLMFTRKSDVLNYIEAAEDVLREEILGYYQERSETLKSIINQIFLEESIYEIDRFSVDTTEFMQGLAKAVRNVGMRQADPSGKYPGAFALEVIITFGEKANIFIQERLSEKNMGKYREYRGSLLNSMENWKDNILFISEKEKQRLHAETWQYLTEDPDIVNVRWELPTESTWVFIKKGVDNVFEIVTNMEKERDLELWQGLAIRELLDKHQGKFDEIFEDAEFLSCYGRLLRRIYMRYIPWYHNLLLLIRVNLFVDNAYQRAKQAIQREQELYSKINKKRRLELKKQQEDIKNTSLTQIQNLSMVNKILETMDHFYFDRKSVPKVQDIAENIDIASIEDLGAFIENNKFQLLAPLGQESSWRNSTLLYPKDGEWDIRKARLKKLAEEVLANKQKLDQGNRLRFQSLLKFIQKSTELVRKKEPESKVDSADDAYERFDSSLKRYDTIKNQKQEEGSEET